MLDDRPSRPQNLQTKAAAITIFQLSWQSYVTIQEKVKNKPECHQNQFPISLAELAKTSWKNSQFSRVPYRPISWNSAAYNRILIQQSAGLIYVNVNINIFIFGVGIIRFCIFVPKNSHYQWHELEKIDIYRLSVTQHW